MNFNFSSQPEYKLNNSLIDEMINLYGIGIKLLITEKINYDDTVFGDYSHLKTDSNKIFEFTALPEVTEDWDTSDFNFNQFGLTNFDNISIFIARKNFENVLDLSTRGMGSVLGNLIVLPNNKIMEITHIEYEVPGINNHFTENDAKSVYKLSLKPYDNKLINEVQNIDISAQDSGEYETLDNYFDELIQTKSIQDLEAVKETTTINKNTDLDEKIQKPVIDKTEDDIFGAF